MKKIVSLLVCLLSGMANAVPIELNWTTTASNLTGAIPGVVGEAITTTFTVDNGGASVLSQSWTDGDFVSYRVEGVSGWWIESFFIDTGSSSGMFSTDGLGDMITAGLWYGGYPSATVTTSWAGDLNGGWWNNGGNEVVCTASASDCVYATDVSDNLIGSSWTASVASSVPEPSSIALLGLGLAGLGFRRIRKAA